MGCVQSSKVQVEGPPEETEKVRRVAGYTDKEITGDKMVRMDLDLLFKHICMNDNTAVSYSSIGCVCAVVRCCPVQNILRIAFVQTQSC